MLLSFELIMNILRSGFFGEKNGLRLGIIDLHTIPCHESSLSEIIQDKKVITLEEHFLPGG